MSPPREYISLAHPHLAEDAALGALLPIVHEQQAAWSTPIRTKRLLLRPFVRTDVGVAHDCLRTMASDPLGYSIEDTRQHLSALLLHQHIYGFSPWGVFLKSEVHTLLGICGFFRQNDDPRPLQLCCDMLPHATRAGYTREALAACVQFGVQHLHLETIEVTAAVYSLLPHPLPFRIDVA